MKTTRNTGPPNRSTTPPRTQQSAHGPRLVGPRNAGVSHKLPTHVDRNLLVPAVKSQTYTVARRSQSCSAMMEGTVFATGHSTKLKNAKDAKLAISSTRQKLSEARTQRIGRQSDDVKWLAKKWIEMEEKDRIKKEEEAAEKEKNIRETTALCTDIGAMVQAKYDDGQWYNAQIEEYDGKTDLYRVTFKTKYKHRGRKKWLAEVDMRPRDYGPTADQKPEYDEFGQEKARGDSIVPMIPMMTPLGIRFVPNPMYAMMLKQQKMMQEMQKQQLKNQKKEPSFGPIRGKMKYTKQIPWAKKYADIDMTGVTRTIDTSGNEILELS